MQKQKAKTENNAKKGTEKEVKREQEQKLIKLSGKLFDLEGLLCRIETINNLLICFANENCEESAVIAELISEKLKEGREILYAE